jgi:hypothetical protein
MDTHMQASLSDKLTKHEEKTMVVDLHMRKTTSESSEDHLATNRELASMQKILTGSQHTTKIFFVGPMQSWGTFLCISYVPSQKPWPLRYVLYLCDIETREPSSPHVYARLAIEKQATTLPPSFVFKENSITPNLSWYPPSNNAHSQYT